MPNIAHAVFFCKLQPIILIFACIQAFFFYWVCKIKVLKMCKMPAITEKLIFEVAIYQVMLAPIFYGTGSIFNSYASHQLNNELDFHFIGSAICVGIGCFNYLNPGNLFQKIVNCLMSCCQCINAKKVYS